MAAVPGLAYTTACTTIQIVINNNKLHCVTAKTLPICFANISLFICNAVLTVVQTVTVLMATFNSYGNRLISTPHKINTPEQIPRKFGTVDYVS